MELNSYSVLELLFVHIWRGGLSSCHFFSFKDILMLVFIDESGKPLFVNSALTPAIQIADIFAGILRHYYENRLDLLTQDKITDPFESWLNNLFLQKI